MVDHVLLVYRDSSDLLGQVEAALRQLADRFVVLACRPEAGAVLGARYPATSDQAVDVRTRPVAAAARLHRAALAGRRGGQLAVLGDTSSRCVDRASLARYEAATTLAAAPSAQICVYPDSTPLRALALGTHPWLASGGGTVANPGCPSPALILRRWADPAPATPPGEPVLSVTGSGSVADLRAVREAVLVHLAAVPTLVRVDFTTAVNEVLTNGYLHGVPPLDLELWVGDDRLECRITDRGPGCADVTAGYRARRGGRRAGMGLWLARQACDEVDLWHDGDAFTVRLATGLPVPGPGRHSGLRARAETNRVRADIFARRQALRSTSSD